MKFDICLGNPPYQETKGTTNIQIWPYFVENATKIADKTCLIHPGRWVVPKKNMVKTNEMMINSGLKEFVLYSNSSEVFKNGINIDGGVTISYFENGYSNNIECTIDDKKQAYNNEDVFISNKYEKEIHDKISCFALNCSNIENRILGNVGSLGTSEFGYNKEKHMSFLSKTPSENSVKIWANGGFGKSSKMEWFYIDKTKINEIPKKLLTTRKVMLDKKGHAITKGKGNVINNIPSICEKESIASGNVFFVIPEVDNDYHLKLIKSFFMTRTIRFLMSIIQKDLCVRGFNIVPDYTYFLDKLNGNLFSDEWFYKEYNFSKELISHIETVVSEKKEKGVENNE